MDEFFTNYITRVDLLSMVRLFSTTKSDKSTVQLVQYFVAGGTAALFDMGSFALLALNFGVDYRIAICFSFIIGVLVNFSITNRYIFDRRSLSLPRALVRTYASALGGLTINELVTILLVEGFGFESLIVAKLVAMGCAFFVNFSLVKFYAFNPRASLRRAFVKAVE